MTAITQAISSALLHFVWQGLLVAFLWRIALATLHKASPRLRYIVSCAALAILIVLPVLTGCAVYRAPLSGSPPTEAGPEIAFTSPAAPLPTPVLLLWLTTVQGWALPVWVAGAAIFATRLIWMSRHIARLQREGDPADPVLIQSVSRLVRQMNIRRPVRLLISKLTDSPSVAGWLRPVIMLPAATLLNLSTDQLEAVLAHELAHVRRHDYLVNVLQILTETLFFYQPAVWWISSRIRTERELCCDDEAVNVCGDAIGYARALTRLERLRAASPGLAMGSTGGSLLYRVRRLTGDTGEQGASKLPALVALSLVLVCLLANLPWARAQSKTAVEATVSRDAIWLDAVKFGELPLKVRAVGKIATADKAELNVPEPQAQMVQSGQSVSMMVRRGLMLAGKVNRVESFVVNGTVTVTIDLAASMPEFVGQEIDGTIQIKILSNVAYIGRPVALSSGAESTVFRIEPDGNHARRVKVRFGQPSVNMVQVLEGLQPGDRVILSDMSKYEAYNRIRIE